MQEEMHHTKQSLEWKAQWWEQCRELPSDISIDGLVREGIAAYADRQAGVQCQLDNHFSDLWYQAGNVLLEGADDESESPVELPDPDADPSSSAYEDDDYGLIDLEESMDDEGIDEDE